MFYCQLYTSHSNQYNAVLLIHYIYPASTFTGTSASSAESALVSVGGSTSLEIQLSRFPGDILERVIFESHLGKIVHDMDSEVMRCVSLELELPAGEVDKVCGTWNKTTALERLETLKQLKEKTAPQLTYRYKGNIFVILITTLLNVW